MKRIALLLALLMLSACGRAPDQSAPRAGAGRDLELGRAVYNFRCYYCHGYSGNARTLAATFLTPSPRDFTAESTTQLTPQQIADAVTHGRPGTAMAPFASTLTPAEIDAVSAFVHDEFVTRRAENTRYHTAENGWPDHERYRSAFPFAQGELAIDTADGQLDPDQLAGRRLFMSACVSCHDRSRVNDEGVTWEARTHTPRHAGGRP